MATDVYYNGVWLHNVSTREFHQEATYDASGTDQMSQHFRMRFEGIIHIQSALELDDDNMWVGPESMLNYSTYSLQSASNVYQQVRARLAQPRRDLHVWVNGEELFKCVPTGTSTTQDPDRDVKNGPRPLTFSLDQIMGGAVFRVSFAVECEKLECGLCETSRYGGADIPYILSNRWSIAESMDSDCFVHRTIQGRMVLSASSWWDADYETPRGLPGHLLKLAVIPGLEDGFRREAIDYAVDPTGLICTYLVSDRQVTVAAPFPLTKLEGTHTETCQNGVDYISDVSVTVSAPPHIDKTVLVARAMQFCEWKLRMLDRKTGPDWMLINAVVTERIGAENVVEASFRIKQSDVEETVQFLNWDAWGNPGGRDALGIEIFPAVAGEPNYDPRVSLYPDTYGYVPQSNEDLGGVRDPAVLTLLHCYLQEPCAKAHGPSPYEGVYEYTNSHGQRQEAKVRGKPAPSTDPDKTDQSSKTSEAHRKAMYTHAVYRSRYCFPQLRVQLPIASTTDESEDSCKIIQLGKGQCRREILYEAERIGEWPQVPKPMDTYKDGDLRGTLLDWTPNPLPPELTLDKEKKIYRIQVTYLYAMNRPPRPDEAIKIGWLPSHAEPTDDADKLKLADLTKTKTLNPGDDTTSENPPSS